MKILTLILLISCAAFAAESGTQLNGYALFYDLKKEDAKEKAEVLAREDFKNGIYRILVYGKRPVPKFDAYGNYLAKYGIECYPIAGCIVSDGILGAADGYNGVMKPLLVQKLGTDIFESYKSEKCKPLSRTRRYSE
jgi:hypothetical protein